MNAHQRRGLRRASPPATIPEPNVIYCGIVFGETVFEDSEEAVETGRADFAKLKTPNPSHSLTNLAPKRGWLTTALAWVASFVYVALYAIVDHFP